MTSDGRAREREQLKTALAPTNACLAAEELSGFADGSLSGASARVSAHLAGCPRCQTELAMLKEFESPTPRPGEDRAVNWIAAELERRFERMTGSSGDRIAARRPRLGKEGARWWQSLFAPRPVSAAALALGAVLLVVTTSLYVRNRRAPVLAPGAGTGPEVLRSEELAVRGPTGDLEQAPAELRWQAEPRAAIYLVILMEVDHAALWKAESRTASVELPAAVRAKIVPGKTLLWQVTAMDATGKTVAVSQIQRFRVPIKPARPRE